MGKVMIIGCILVAFVWVVFASNGLEDGYTKHHHNHHRHLDPSIHTCSDLGMCCQDKNNTCRAHGKSMREKGNHKYCYCDAHCMATRDCCLDYESACPRVDCILDDWGPWGDCSKLCGWGEKRRSRDVLRGAMNNGRPCENTQQRAFCYGTNCKFSRHAFGAEIRETGKIIPAEYGPWRKNKLYNPYEDIRKNLFNHHGEKRAGDRPAYCAHFEITESRSSCKLFDGSGGYTKGATVCVECQPLAMKRQLGTRCRGHGVYLRETRWNAVTVPGCHGKWVMQERHDDCKCDPSKETAYILI